MEDEAGETDRDGDGWLGLRTIPPRGMEIGALVGGVAMEKGTQVQPGGQKKSLLDEAKAALEQEWFTKDAVVRVGGGRWYLQPPEDWVRALAKAGCSEARVELRVTCLRVREVARL